MANYTEMINQVLRRLRESEVSSPTANDYSKVIGEFVNEAKREVEDAWSWSVLRNTNTVTTADGTSQYVVDFSVDASDRASDRFSVMQVYDTTNNFHLSAVHWSYGKQQIDIGANGPPLHYFMENRDSNLDPYINFVPTPNGVYNIEVLTKLPQKDFTVGTENLLVPAWPVILGAYAKAVAERGEDDGRASGEAYNSYGNALSDAIALDNSNLVFESEWYVG